MKSPFYVATTALVTVALAAPMSKPDVRTKRQMAVTGGFVGFGSGGPKAGTFATDGKGNWKTKGSLAGKAPTAPVPYANPPSYNWSPPAVPAQLSQSTPVLSPQAELIPYFSTTSATPAPNTNAQPAAQWNSAIPPAPPAPSIPSTPKASLKASAKSTDSPAPNSGPGGSGKITAIAVTTKPTAAYCLKEAGNVTGDGKDAKIYFASSKTRVTCWKTAPARASNGQVRQEMWLKTDAACYIRRAELQSKDDFQKLLEQCA